jgi:hypothetical protein
MYNLKYVDLQNKNVIRVNSNTYARICCCRILPRIVRVPYRILLDLMLQELGISKGAYHIELCEEKEVSVTMLFNASMLPLEGSPVYISMPRIQSKDYEIAQDTTCIKAPGYIEEATNTVIRDWNYTWLKELEEQNKSLVHG